MYVYLHILSFKFETKVRSMRVLNRKEGAEAGKNGDGKGNMQIKAGRCVVMHDAPSFLFITDINRFIFFKLR